MYYADEPKLASLTKSTMNLFFTFWSSRDVFRDSFMMIFEARQFVMAQLTARTILALENEFLEVGYVGAQDSFVATVTVAVKGFEQHSHSVIMISLNNAYSHADLTAFVNRALAAESERSMEIRIDCVVLSLEYQDHELCRALTRGTGRVGDEVTDNVRESLVGSGKVDRIPQPNVPDVLIVRGEV
ncbi:unnamed protein product [Agarophyton chilense]